MRYIFLLAVLMLATPAFGAGSCDGRVCNPMSFGSVPELVAGLAKVSVIMAVPLVALALVYSGFLFIKARGKSGELTTAKNNFQYVLMGATLILGAWVFATLLWGTVGQLLNGSSTQGKPIQIRGGLEV